MNKNEEESLSRTIRKVTDNIEILMNGGMLIDPNDGGVSEKINSIETDYTLYNLEDFSKLTEHIIPKTDREIALELEIAGLKDQLKTAGSVKMGGSSKPRKIPVTLSKNQNQIIVDYYLVNKNASMKDIAAKYNVCSNTVSRILKEANVRIPGKRQREITYAE